MAPSLPFVHAFVHEWNKLWFLLGLLWIIDVGAIHSGDTEYLAPCRHILKFSSLDGYRDNNPVSYSEKVDIVYSGGWWLKSIWGSMRMKL